MKTRIFLTEARRTLNFGTVICMAGVIFSICFDSWNDLLRALGSQSGSVHYFFWNSGFGGVCRQYFLPVFAALPFAVSFCREYNENMLPFIVTREGKNSYCIIKYVVTILSGGLAVAAATGVLILFLAARLPMADAYGTEAAVDEVFNRYLALYHPVQYSMVEIGNAFLRGALWSAAALCVSAFFTDPFVTVVSPYLISMLYVQITRILKVPSAVRLNELLSGRWVILSGWHTLAVSAAAVSVILLLLAVVFVKKVRRRMEHA